jgi:phosphatidylserine decarboxylase
MSFFSVPHQYVDRQSGKVITESLLGDRMVAFLYSRMRERVPAVFNALISARLTSVLGHLRYDGWFDGHQIDSRKMAARLGINLDECLEAFLSINTLRQLFERKIRYWEVRTMANLSRQVVSPSDARLLVGSLDDMALLPIKGKFFDYPELLGAPHHPEYCKLFDGGDVAIFRLTPDKYHYNHVPVSGRVLNIYTVDGVFHACNPGAVVSAITPFSKNRRVVTIIDTDVSNGSQVGCVAMVEVVAMMIGDIRQCYSRYLYDEPEDIKVGMWLEMGCPKSLYRPGSSTTILLFEKDRVRFAKDILANLYRYDVNSRFSLGFGRPLVETDVRVRSQIAKAKQVT